MRIKAGAGAFVCGEETTSSPPWKAGCAPAEAALPRPKGLLAKPSNINLT